MRETGWRAVPGRELRGSWSEVRKRLSGRAVDVGLRGLSRLAALHPRANPARYGVDIQRDLAYGPAGNAHRLDVYRPRTAKGDAAPILYLHGGGFRILSKETHWGMALAFAHRGHVVFVPNYRLAPEHPFPAGPEDACRATLWVHEHAKDYGADAQRLVLAGESAGANLSLVVAIANAWERPEPWARAVFDAGLQLRGILPACGLLQVTEPAHRGSDGWVLERITQISAQYLSAGFDGASRDMADVVSFLETAPPPVRELPPLFAICGGADPVVKDTERLTPAWRALGGEADHKLYGDGFHAFHAFLWTALARAAWADQHAFLERILTEL